MHALTTLKSDCPNRIVIATPRVLTAASVDTSTNDSRVESEPRSQGSLKVLESAEHASSEKSTVLTPIATLVFTAWINFVRISGQVEP
jgi:hypothetical protein